MPGPGAVERPAVFEEFKAGLRHLREQAGEPSFRRMALKSGAVSHATLHLTVTGHRLQPWETVREFVRACDGDEDAWYARWQQVALALADEPDDQQAPEPATEVAANPAPMADPAPATAPALPWWRSTWTIALLVVIILALGAFLVIQTIADQGAGQERTDPRAMLHEGDASKFIRDVTYPDGTVVPPESQFVKVWEIRNTGSVEWRDRYLQRIDLPIGPDDCATPERIPVNNTRPRQNVQITVTVRTPAKAPVDCKVRWKMVDASGRMLMPGYRPIYFEVRVRDQ